MRSSVLPASKMIARGRWRRAPPAGLSMSRHYNESAMRPLSLTLLLSGVIAICVPLGAGIGQADHGGPLRSAPMSPLTVAILAARLPPVGLRLIALVVRILIRATRAPE